MTALRPERAPGGQDEPSSYDYESTGEIAAAVDGLADPLNDPLPGRDQPAGGSRWFRPSQTPQQPQEPVYGAGAGASGYDPTPPPAQAWQAAGGAGTYGYAQPRSQAAPSLDRQHQPRATQQPQQPQQASYEAPYEPPAPYGPLPPAWTTSEPDAPQAPAPQAPAPEASAPEVSAPQPRRPARRRRPVDGGETSVMPALDLHDMPGGAQNPAPQAPETPSPGRAARRRAAASGAAAGAGSAAGDEAAATASAAEGGRAARRKAAQQASRKGGRRARGHAAGSSAPEQTEQAAHAPRSRVEARRAARAAKESPGVIASRLVGEVFITVGVLMLLFVTYQLWWSNILAHQEAGGAANSLQNEWNNGDSEKNSTFTDGQNFAIIYIPKLDVKAPIAQGVSKPKVLDKGMVGHYDGSPFETAMPWDKSGNFALAAHRNTHGEPFRYINKLVKGDKVVVETQSTYYTYEITSTLPQTSPSNISVIEPIPTGSGFTKAGRYITLTTCTPEFTSTYRLIVWGKMVGEQPRSKGTPAVLQGG